VAINAAAQATIAQKTADDAKGDAAAAQAAADEAKATAEAAQLIANTAVETAASAQSEAYLAAQSAEDAQVIADNAEERATEITLRKGRKQIREITISKLMLMMLNTGLSFTLLLIVSSVLPVISVFLAGLNLFKNCFISITTLHFLFSSY
jgi:hypothetical protein